MSVKNVIGTVLQADNTVSSKFGVAYIIYNGSRVEVASLQKVNAKLEFTTAEIKAAGTMMKQHKVVAAEGKGNATWFWNSSKLTKLVINSIKAGKGFVIDELEMTNDDPASGVGSQVAVISHVIVSSKVLAQWDASSDDVLTEDADFVFDDENILKDFSEV